MEFGKNFAKSANLVRLLKVWSILALKLSPEIIPIKSEALVNYFVNVQILLQRSIAWWTRFIRQRNNEYSHFLCNFRNDTLIIDIIIAPIICSFVENRQLPHAATMKLGFFKNCVLTRVDWSTINPLPPRLNLLFCVRFCKSAQTRKELLDSPVFLLANKVGVGVNPRKLLTMKLYFLYIPVTTFWCFTFIVNLKVLICALWLFAIYLGSYLESGAQSLAQNEVRKYKFANRCTSPKAVIAMD